MASATGGLHQIRQKYDCSVSQGRGHQWPWHAKSVLIEVSLKGTGQPRKRLPEVCFCWPWWWSTHWQWFGLWVSEQLGCSNVHSRCSRSCETHLPSLKTLCSAPSGLDTPNSISQERRKSTQRKNSRLLFTSFQCIPTFLTLGTSFVKEFFHSQSGGMVWGWFKWITFIGHFYSYSNAATNMTGGTYRSVAHRLGTPVMKAAHNSRDYFWNPFLTF